MFTKKSQCLSTLHKTNPNTHKLAALLKKHNTPKLEK